MSRNNVIIVARYKGRYYVLPNLNADRAWEDEFLLEMLQKDQKDPNDQSGHQLKSTHNRGRALVIAHDFQKELDTEYGVHETTVA
jgi:hypothetical protein